MKRILIVYGTSYGQTARIVRAIAGVLEDMRFMVTCRRGDELRDDTPLDGFDAVLVAGSVLFGRHQRYIEEFARTHATTLAALPSGFLSVCGALGGSWVKGEKEAAGYREDFARRTGWHPARAWSVAGRVAYTEYPFLVRLVMQLISWRTGLPTDTSRNYEFTDWSHVERIARLFGDEVGEIPVASPASSPSQSAESR
jgi:menaquinone-dependent protoporphyrinogen oxidase